MTAVTACMTACVTAYLDVGEEVGETEVLVGVLPGEDLQQVPHVPGGPEHVVVDLPLPHRGRLPVHHDLLDDEAHPREAARVHGVAPDRVLVDLVDAVDQADEVVDGGLGVGAAHLLVEPVVRHQ